MDIQDLKHSDIKDIPGLLPLGWEGELPTIEFYARSNFCFPIKVIDGQKIVGIGTVIIHQDTAWLAHIIVHPDHRKQGIGKVITQTLVDTAHAKGCETIYLLSTELGESIYKSIGFVLETEYLIYRCEGSNGIFNISENIIPINSDFKKPILDLDRQASGEYRALLLEPHLSDGYLYVQDKEVQGFYLPTLGDGLIIATTSLAGQELMKLRLGSKDFAAFPIENESAAALMKQCNFNDFRTEKRMRLGKQRNWQPQNIYSIIGGNLG